MATRDFVTQEMTTSQTSTESEMSTNGSTTASSSLGQYELVWTSEVLFRVTTIIVVMVLTLIGNSSLIIGIVCQRTLRRKRVNIFLVNLAIGDLMVCLVTMTTEILFVAFGEWVMGAAACKIIVYGQIVTLASATFLLTAMSIDRFQVIVQPFRSLAGQPKIWRKVMVAWLLALVFAVPQLFIFVQTDEGIMADGSTKHLCRSQGYTAKWQRKLYFSVMTVYVLLIPTVIMSYCYIRIIAVVWMRTSARQEHKAPKLRFVSNFPSRSHTASSSDMSACSKNRHSRVENQHLNIPPRLLSSSKRSVVKMTLSVIIGFVVCWTPYFIISLIRIFSDYTIPLKQGLSVAEIMALVHSALNPILYGIFSTQMTKRACSQFCLRFRQHPHAPVVHEVVPEVSEGDSSYWSDTKVQAMARFAVVQTTDRKSRGQPLRDNRGAGFSDCLEKFFCCRMGTGSEKPLLLYRKAGLNGTQPRVISPAKYESFRLRTQSVNANPPLREIPEPQPCQQNGVSVTSSSHNNCQLVAPRMPPKSVSDSYLNRSAITFTDSSCRTHNNRDFCSQIRYDSLSRHYRLHDDLPAGSNVLDTREFASDIGARYEMEDYFAKM